MAPGRKGRTPLLLDKETLNAYLDNIRLGLPQKDAAARVGWSEGAILDWKAVAADATTRGGKLTQREKECVEFAQLHQRAVGECKGKTAGKRAS